MDTTQAHRAVADLEQELAAIEATWAGLDHRRKVLLSLIAGYRELFPVADQTGVHPGLPKRIIIDESRSYLPRNRKGSTPDRIVDVLTTAAPRHLSPREVMNELISRGWTTTSHNPIMIVRNTLAGMMKSGLVEKETRHDGTVGFRLKNTEGPALAGPSGVIHSSAAVTAVPEREEVVGDDADSDLDLHPAPVAGAS